MPVVDTSLTLIVTNGVRDGDVAPRHDDVITLANVGAHLVAAANILFVLEPATPRQIALSNRDDVSANEAVEILGLLLAHDQGNVFVEIVH